MDEPITEPLAPAETPPSAPPQTETRQPPKSDRPGPDFVRGSGALDGLLKAEEETAKPEAKPAADAAPPVSRPSQVREVPHESAPFDRANLPEDIRLQLEKAEKLAKTIERMEADGYESDDDVFAKLAEADAKKELAARMTPIYDRLAEQIGIGEKTPDQANAEYNRELEAAQKDFGLERREAALNAREEQEAAQQWEAEYNASIEAHDNLKGDDDTAKDAQSLVRALSASGGMGGAGQVAPLVSGFLANVASKAVEAARKGIEENAVARYAGRGLPPPAPIYGGSPPPTRLDDQSFRSLNLDQLLNEN